MSFTLLPLMLTFYKQYSFSPEKKKTLLLLFWENYKKIIHKSQRLAHRKCEINASHG